MTYVSHNYSIGEASFFMKQIMKLLVCLVSVKHTLIQTYENYTVFFIIASQTIRYKL